MDLFNKISDSIKRHDLKRHAERVNEDYQISERKGKLWITFCGCPIIPEDLLSVNIIEALDKIRHEHIKDKV
jgi:hypothetical protein